MGTLVSQLKGLKIKVPFRKKEEPLHQPKRIYIRPTSDAKKALRLARKTRQPKVVRCKICFSVVDINETVEIEGGGTQGHPSFLMCIKHTR